MKYGMLLVLALTVLVGCEPTQPTGQTLSGEPLTESQRLNQWLDREFVAYLDFSPLSKTRRGDKSDYDKLDDPSDAAADVRLAWRRSSVASLKAEFDRAALDAEAKRSYDLWVLMLDRAEAALAYRRYEYVFGRNGPHTGLPNALINYHKVDSASDMQAYIARLKASADYFDAYLQRAKLAAAAGIRAPYFDYDVAVSQIQRVTQGAPFTVEGTSALWADITAKVDALVVAESITAVEATALKAAAKTAILDAMAPAYDRILGWLHADRDRVSDTATGAWALPDGAAFYAYRLQRMTTLPLTAEAIHQTGLEEVARIQAEMNEIQASVGFEGSLQDFFTHLRTSDEFYFENTDQGREGYLQLARDFIKGIEAKLPDYFGILPKGPLEVRRVEAFREQAGGAAHYMRGTKDGSRPGVFYAHLADMRAMSIFRLENLAYHEGLPGHHLQISIQQALDGLPRFRTYHGYTAYSEGWGLYSEFLGKEMGFYQDPYRDFGRLTGEIWRAIRLVVDTGIHAKGWTEAEAIDYALTNSPRPEPTVRSEVRRYFNMPAQATAYKVGMLEIQRIRAKAEGALKDRFDIRDFHDQILGSGPLPMPVLERKIDDWIAASL
ncbi:DUF885 domain-containing protein [Pseudomonadales bacterium]|jgi:uncharacterized protein (DUF885 family)|nr:DUF885 domain-containing protein [Pseudomonadales bacterium]MDC1298302.1 DUF885 domain-containing protein [Pseudomonadales bacterium]MDC3343528.1 DUF885 domain-containing protein [Pseudomonadales bacterium]